MTSLRIFIPFLCILIVSVFLWFTLDRCKQRIWNILFTVLDEYYLQLLYITLVRRVLKEKSVYEDHSWSTFGVIFVILNIFLWCQWIRVLTTSLNVQYDEEILYMNNWTRIVKIFGILIFTFLSFERGYIDAQDHPSQNKCLGMASD